MATKAQAVLQGIRSKAEEEAAGFRGDLTRKGITSAAAKDTACTALRFGFEMGALWMLSMADAQFASEVAREWRLSGASIRRIQ